MHTMYNIIKDMNCDTDDVGWFVTVMNQDFFGNVDIRSVTVADHSDFTLCDAALCLFVLFMWSGCRSISSATQI